VAKAVEQFHLLLAVAPGRVVGRQILDDLPHAGTNLVSEVRRRRPHELVDLLDHGVAHGPKASG
jgi:hypothetical protein